MRESIKTSQDSECLNRIRAGETNGAVHSSGKGTGMVTPRGDPDTAPVEHTPGAGREKVEIGI